MRTAYVILLLLLTCFGCKKQDFAWNRLRFPETTNLIIENNSTSQVLLRAECVNDGNSNATERGFCWSTNAKPTVEDSVVIVDGFGTGNFTGSISWNNSLDTSVIVRAFSRNEIGVNYSNSVVVFNPILTSDLPEVMTDTAVNIYSFEASLNGEVISGGGIDILEYGFCYSNSNASPDINDSYSSTLADHNGPFEIQVTGLDDNQTYYFRAFARNALGVSYGTTMQFHTLNDYNIGETGPGGGLIFYKKAFPSDGWQYMETHPYEWSNVLWSSQSSSVGPTSPLIGAGPTNTATILASDGSFADAAFTCSSFGTSYNDWFLPSLDEMQMIYQNLHSVGLGNTQSNAEYWTSTEDENYTENAWVVQFSNPSSMYSVPKASSLRVKPVRCF